MLQKIFSLGLVAVVAGSAMSCGSRADAQPGCYSGKIVGITCMNGVLVDVSPLYRIGAEAVASGANKVAVLGRNVISVSNSQEVLGLIQTSSSNQTTVGTTLYFTVAEGSAHGGLHCFVNDGVDGQVPDFELQNVSTTGCEIVPE